MDDAEVDTMVREAITASVGDNQFLHTKIDTWSNNIVEGCLKRLAALNKPFKYVVTCNLTQKAGAGLHASSCTRWNEKTDGKLTVQWENNTMIILVTVYWQVQHFDPHVCWAPMRAHKARCSLHVSASLLLHSPASCCPMRPEHSQCS